MPTVISGPARTYGSTTISTMLVAGALGSLLLQLIVVPLVLLPRDPAFAWLLVPLVLTSTHLWSILHESIHGSLVRGRAWNDRAGRAPALAAARRHLAAAHRRIPRRAGPDRVRPVEGSGAPRVGGAAGCGGPWVNDDQPAEQTVPFRVNATGSTFGPE